MMLGFAVAITSWTIAVLFTPQGRSEYRSAWMILAWPAAVLSLGLSIAILRRSWGKRA